MAEPVKGLNKVQLFVEDDIKHFVESRSSERSGLFLVDMPTGTGKTYMVADMMAKFLKGELFADGIKRMFYLTPLNKNIDDFYQELKTLLGDESLLEAKVLRLNPNYSRSEFISTFRANESTIKRCFASKSESYQKLSDAIDFIRKLSGYQKDSNGKQIELPSDDALLAFEDRIRLELEPEFRTTLREIIETRAPKLTDRKQLLASDDWQWVKKLYPAVFLEDRPIVLMSVDKFLSTVDPIIRPRFTYLNSSYLDGSVFFVDEIDSAHDFILNSLINRSGSKNIDVAKVISDLSANFAAGNKIPEAAFRMKDRAKAGRDNEFSSLSQYEKMREKVYQTRREYHLDYPFKYDGEELDKAYLFQSDVIQTIDTASGGKGGNDTISVYTDIDKGQNLIAKNGKGDAHDFFRLIYGLRSCLNYAIGSMAIWSLNLLEAYNSEKQAAGANFVPMEVDDAVSTVLSHFPFDGTPRQRMQELVTERCHRKSQGSEPHFFNDFYEDGFCYYDFENALAHETTTKIGMYYMSETPEKLLEKLAKSAYVIGLSATATNASSIGNFNLEYLQGKLKDGYRVLSDESEKKIDAYIRNSEEIRGNKAEARVIVKKDDADDWMKELLNSSSDRLDKLKEHLSHLGPQPDEDSEEKSKGTNFVKNRFLSMLEGIKLFVDDNKRKSMLVILNRNVTFSNDKRNQYSKSNLQDIIKLLGGNDISIFCLSGKNFESEKRLFLDAWRSGKKVVGFTSYQAASTGQNLQLKIEGGNHSEPKDIETLYLEYPRNILVNIHDSRTWKTGLPVNDLLKYLCQINALSYDGEISVIERKRLIQNGFFAHSGKRGSGGANPYDCSSVNNAALKQLQQAVGRICRTQKGEQKDVLILLDSEVIDKVDFSSVKGKPMNLEFRKIVELSNNHEPSEHDMETANLTKAANLSESLARQLDRVASGRSWDEKSMKNWVAFRDFAIKHPTCTKEELEREPYEFRKLYLPLKEGCERPHYYASSLWSDGADYTTGLVLSYEATAVAKKEIKEPPALRLLLKDPGLLAFFEENHYATRFEKGDFMLNPVAYQRIYLGALGEAVGSFVFKKYGLPCKEITEANQFEKFDFKIEGHFGTFVDFKCWSSPNEVKDSRYLDRVKAKLVELNINGSIAIIANIYSNDEALKHSVDGNIILVPHLYIRKKEPFSNEYKPVIDKREIKFIHDAIAKLEGKNRR